MGRVVLVSLVVVVALVVAAVDWCLAAVALSLVVVVVGALLFWSKVMGLNRLL